MLVGGAPRAVSVVPGPAHAPRTMLRGGGLHEARVGVAATFELIARDYYGNRRESGGEPFVVDARPASLALASTGEATSDEPLATSH